MNKYLTLAFFAFLTIVSTLIAHAIEVGYSDSLIVPGEPPDLAGEDVGTMINTFWSMVTFRLEGVPLIINVVFFAPIGVAVIFMIVDVLKHMIPFT